MKGIFSDISLSSSGVKFNTSGFLGKVLNKVYESSASTFAINDQPKGSK